MYFDSMRFNKERVIFTEYRKLPHGGENEKFSVLGLGMGGIGKTPADEIEAIIRKAIDNGINFFDLCIDYNSETGTFCISLTNPKAISLTKK